MCIENMFFLFSAEFKYPVFLSSFGHFTWHLVQISFALSSLMLIKFLGDGKGMKNTFLK